eukprot:TRINITY_DN30168_c0_g1_i1.p1 TRINITY_DN30168_c0_g1~~TRINITY_DN30168_c0_g1_i1.p1  ORF type:complete len:101 (+),score=13.99 TRINITY_DN30168_c0_g1_i1:76-378(+)
MSGSPINSCSSSGSVCRVEKRPCGFAYTGYDGHKVWNQLHKAVKEIPCMECREHGTNIMNFVHDFVNVGLGKTAKHPGNFHRIAQQVHCADRICTAQNRC